VRDPLTVDMMRVKSEQSSRQTITNGHLLFVMGALIL